MKRSFLVLSGAAAVLVPVSIALLTSPSVAQPKEDRSVAAIYTGGILRISIPYNAPRIGGGDLTVEVLDPEDAVAARTDRHAYATPGQGLWRQNLALSKPLPFEDLVWHRLRYRFTYDGDRAAAIQGITSISRILRLPAVHVFGQRSYLSGAAAAVRLIVTEVGTQTPVRSGSVQIQLLGAGQKPQLVYTGTLNERGTTQAHFRFPAGLAGNYSLHYVLDTALGPAEYTQPIQLDDKASILLTTEKPIYQPGQTIHARALALDRSNHEAAGGRKLTFEIEDSRGNKVFRKITQTDDYGVGSSEFALAEEVNLGTYHLRALLDQAPESPRSQTEIALTVDRYVLPRFKVAVEMSGKDSKAKRGYRPGDHVAGIVRANYFFGKPVAGEVAVKVSGMDTAPFEVASSQARLDSDGAFHFDITLPDFFVGHPSSQGAARVLVHATVKDTAGHSESGREFITVSESPLLITAVPEGGTLVPGLENQLLVVTSYPDGTSAEADIRIEATGFAPQTASTDRSGIATVSLLGAPISPVRIEARDREGNHASVRLSLQSRPGSDQVLLRPERAIYRIGEQIRVQVFSTLKSGSAYVDLVKNGQSIATYDAYIVNGRAQLGLAATSEMTGSVELYAYVLGHDSRPIHDHRLVFVEPADEIRIQTSQDSSYKPGGEARIGFQVTNSRGEGVQAALGLEIIDQAVFALAEKQPGFAKVFFYLAQELMKPRYEIHSVSLPEVISSTDPAESNRRDRAARALFAATELLDTNNASTEFGSTVPRNKYRDYAAHYEKRLRAEIDQIAGIEARPFDKNSEMCDQHVLTALLQDRNRNALDAWGNNLRVEPRNPGTRTFGVRSAGPDGQFNTSDDLVVYREDRYCIEPHLWNSGNIHLKFQRPEAALKGQAEITGTAWDPAGAVIPRAAIELLELATSRVHSLHADADGRFSLAGLKPGRYEIQVSMAGFQTAGRVFSLEEGDRVVLSVVLQVGAVTETVTVEAAAPVLNTATAAVSPRAAQVAPSIKKMDTAPTSQAATAETHVRAWFPEALYVAPEIITDRYGRASITIPLADKITTWRMAMLASTKQGALGSGTSSLKVFQDFFTEFDLPVTLTEGDQVSLPVAIYNYSGSRGRVRLALQQDSWFSLAGDQPEKTLAVESGRVSGSQFVIEARHIGNYKLTLKAEMEGPARRADIVVREIEVVPNGREQSVAFNGRLESSAERLVTFPPNAIPDASKIFVRLYPGPMSQLVEGMDAILRMPFGCFEQTSSATYPNVLALDYMKRTKRLTPEVHAKAEGFIANGYQRLLTFEVPGGGFSWFGQAPANKILTAYGLMEFSDMSRVHDIDERVMQRTERWLAAQQQPNGSWKPDTSFINEGATNRYNSDLMRITSYIAWSLERSGYQGPEVERAREFIHTNRDGKLDAYTLAVLANFAVDSNDRAFAHQVIQQLLDSRMERGDQAWWTAEETGVYGGGASAAVETTGLAARALFKSGEFPDIVRKALNYIVARKDASGTWATTQATIMALHALLLSTEKGSADARGTVEITLNGKPAGKLTITPDNADIFQQVVLKGIDSSGSNDVAILFHGEGSLAYQVAGRYFVPWAANPEGEPLSINVSYDRTRLAQDDIATAVATVKSHMHKTANMVMVDLGIPPGFDVLTEDLEDYRHNSAGRKSGRLEKFNLTASQAVLYFNSIARGDTVKVRYRLRAKYPIRTRTFPSRVYEYYDPEVSSISRPVQMEIYKR